MSAFQYAPEWQGPLSGRSFEKQTEDAINAILQRLDEVAAAQSQVATQTSNGLMSAADKVKLDGIQNQLDALDARIPALE
jgi:hypothetical protein